MIGKNLPSAQMRNQAVLISSEEAVFKVGCLHTRECLSNSLGGRMKIVQLLLMSFYYHIPSKIALSIFCDVYVSTVHAHNFKRSKYTLCLCEHQINAFSKNFGHHLPQERKGKEVLCCNASILKPQESLFQQHLLGQEKV